jgi:hypothetical protein
MIQPGETYRRSAAMDGGTAWTWRECAHCEVLLQWLVRTDALWGGDDGYSQDSVVEWEPESLSDLRLKACWKQKWTRRDGALMPVPVKTMREMADGWRYLAEVVAS